MKSVEIVGVATTTKEGIRVVLAEEVDPKLADKTKMALLVQKEETRGVVETTTKEVEVVEGETTSVGGGVETISVGGEVEVEEDIEIIEIVKRRKVTVKIRGRG